MTPSGEAEGMSQFRPVAFEEQYGYTKFPQHIPLLNGMRLQCNALAAVRRVCAQSRGKDRPVDRHTDKVQGTPSPASARACFTFSNRNQ